MTRGIGNSESEDGMNRHKIGLCIVHRNHNYGGVLQSYATLLKMQEIGADYEIIDYRHPSNLGYYAHALRCSANKVTLASKFRSVKKKIGKKVHRAYANNERIRGRKFDEFTRDRFVKFSKPIRDYKELREYAGKFTDILVGSDQLWLPSGLGTGFYNLMFAPDECNKIAYSASFGVSVIPKNQIAATREYLQRIQHISLREEAGAKIVKELTGRDVPVILDPTMIVTKEQWDASIPDRRVVDGEYIFCYFLGSNQEHRDAVRKLAKATGKKIVVLRHIDEYIPEDENFGDIAPYDVGPEEFVNLIRHAAYVCTDSFHGSVFSIIYRRQFISFNRFAEGANSRNSRLDTLFRNIGISRRFAGDIVTEIDQPIDYDAVEERLAAMREQSCRYLAEALGEDYEELAAAGRTEDGALRSVSTAAVAEAVVKADGTKSARVICPTDSCVGCAACEAACPKQAITMIRNEKGFDVPFVERDSCVDCGACERVCPVNTAPATYGPTRVFMFQHRSDDVRFLSTSGGFFRAVADRTIAEGGVVCGACFTEDMKLVHAFAETSEEVVRMQKSKYVQSSLSGVFRKIREYRRQGRKVLFVGMPCQAAGLRKYIGEDDGLVIIDLVCYGVPSPGLFEDWVAYLNAQYGKRGGVTDVIFRDKSYGYASPNVKVKFADGSYIESCRDASLYTDLFFRHLSIRNSCYGCHFKSVDRASDITLGDLWLVKEYDSSKDDNKGTTAVFAHTEAGLAIARSSCAKELDLDAVVSADATKLTETVKPAGNVGGFWKKYEEDGFESLIGLYEKKTMKSRCKYLVKRAMNKTGVASRWYRREKVKKLGKRG